MKKPKVEPLRLPTIEEEVGKLTLSRMKEQKEMNALLNSMEVINVAPPNMMTILFDQFAAKQMYNFTAWQRYTNRQYLAKNTKESKKQHHQPIYDDIKHTGFSPSEKESLRNALRTCVINSRLTYQAAKLDFDGYEDELKLWFGTNNSQLVQKIKNGIYKMHKVLCDPKQIIDFIDMRHQKSKNTVPSSVVTPAPGLSTCYGIRASNFVNETTNPLLPKHLGKGLPPNSGPGIRLLVGEHMMQPYKTIDERALIIYHEVTHKILSTYDAGHVCLSGSGSQLMPIFGADASKNIAREDPMQAIYIADCWANFVAHVAESVKSPPGWEMI